MPTKNKLPNLAPKLPAKGKARVMYDVGTGKLRVITESPIGHFKPRRPVAVASLSPEAEEARVEAGARAIAEQRFGRTWTKRYFNGSITKPMFTAQARIVLASAGLLAGGKKGAK